MAQQGEVLNAIAENSLPPIKRRRFREAGERFVIQPIYNDCPLSCGFGCSDGYIMQRHLAKEHENVSHNNLSWYKCPRCNLEYFDISSLEYHIDNTHENRNIIPTNAKEKQQQQPTHDPYLELHSAVLKLQSTSSTTTSTTDQSTVTPLRTLNGHKSAFKRSDIKNNNSIVIPQSRIVPTTVLINNDNIDRKSDKLYNITSTWNFHNSPTTTAGIKEPESPINIAAGIKKSKQGKSSAVKDRFTLITSFDWDIDPVIHSCPYGCGREFDSLNGLEAHIKNQHAEEHKNDPKQMPTFTFACKFCTYVCQYKQRLVTHLNKEHSSEFHKIGDKKEEIERLEPPQWDLGPCMRACPYTCGKEYSSLAGLKSHLKSHHLSEQSTNPLPLPEFVFRCSYCDANFPARTLLVTHLNKEHVSDYYTKNK